MKAIILSTLILMFSTSTFGQEGENSEVDTLTGFGFGPALFLLNYDKEILQDTGDITVSSNNTLKISDTKNNKLLGLEIHYGISFGIKCRNSYTKSNPPCKAGHIATSGQTFSPYVGLFDIENGFNGYSFGVLYGFWRGDNKFQAKRALNFGIGRFVHKDQLVANDGVTNGQTHISTNEIGDYSKRSDVYGYSLMISAEIGF